MDFPSGQAESPSHLRGIAGPSRARLQARQHRNSASKPYDRRSLIADSIRTRNDSLLSSSALSIKSGKSKADQESLKRGGGIGLLSGLRQAIFSRPLSWLQGSTTKSSNLTPALPSHSVPSAAQRLAASVKGSKEGNDIESHADGIAGKIKPIVPPSTMTKVATQPTPAMFSYTPARSPSPARSSASAIIRSRGQQRLSLGPPSQTPNFGGSTLGTPGYRRGGSLRPDSGSVSGIAASQSSPSYAFGFGSERRMAGVSSAVSAHNLISPSPLASSSYVPLPSRSPFAMNRHSFAGSSTGGSTMGVDRSPRVSGLHLLATPSRSRPASMFGGETNRSRAGSIAESRMSTASQTPRKREWSSLKLAPPKADMSAGEELMQAYLAMRNGTEGSKASAHPALQNGAASDTLLMEFGAGPSLQSQSIGQHDESAHKRGADMSLDGDENMSQGTPRKRQKQMVWDAEMGFVSKEDLRARRPPKPVAQNEAERLLNALEGMRGSVEAVSGGASSRGGTVSETSSARERGFRLTSENLKPLRQMMPVSVPLPVPERSDMNSGVRRKRVEDYNKVVSPYSRAMRHKLSQSVEPEEGKGLKSRLQRPSAGTSTRASSTRGEEAEAVEDGETSDASMDGAESHNEYQQSSRASEMAEDEKDDDEQVVEPPRRKPIAAKGSEKVDQTKTLRSGKVLPPSPVKRDLQNSATTASLPKLSSLLTQTSKPMSKARLEISVGGTSTANRQKATQQAQQPTAPSHKESSLFQVRTEPAPERSRSTLRQGAEKTNRTHVRSGRVGLDEDDEDDVDDLPSADELNKIKLPVNLFPQGFTFSSASSPSLGSNIPVKSTEEATSEPVLKALPAPSDDPEKQTADKSNKGDGKEGASSSLLSRLGGFAPPESKPSSAPNKLAAPSFSFTSPPKASEPSAPASKPLFSFQSNANASSADFFSAPKPAAKEAPAAATPPAGRNDGPIPNFFASSLAKTDVKETAAPSTQPFPFSQPAAPKSDSNTTSFQFGAKEANTGSSFGSTSIAPSSQPPVTSFSFATKTADASGSNKESPPAFQGFGGSTSIESKKEADKSAPPTFSFNAPSSSLSGSSASPVSGFSSDSSKKRGAEDEESGPQKKANGSTRTSPFSFGENTSAPKATGFSFGAPKANEAAQAEPGKALFSFGAPSQSKVGGASDSKPVAASSTSSSSSSGFGFGSANKSEMMDTSPSSNLNGSNVSSTMAFGGSTTPTPASKPAFSFGAPSASSASTSNPAASQAGFAFSSPSPAKPNSTPSVPSFNFAASSNTNGGNNNPFGHTSNSNPFGGASASSTPSTGGFGGGGFGSNNSTTDNSRQGAQTSFAFGGPSSNSNQPMGGGFGGGFGQGQSQGSAASQPMATTSSTPAFTFGAAPSGGTAPTTPGTGNAPGFSFSLPGSNTPTTNTNSFMAPSSPGPSAPFVFGSAGASTPPATQTSLPPASGFNFNTSAPASPGGGNLFNMGAPPPPGSGNRPVRGMPSRRKR